MGALTVTTGQCEPWEKNKLSAERVCWSSPHFLLNESCERNVSDECCCSCCCGCYYESCCCTPPCKWIVSCVLHFACIIFSFCHLCWLGKDEICVCPLVFFASSGYLVLFRKLNDLFLFFTVFAFSFWHLVLVRVGISNKKRILLFFPGAWWTATSPAIQVHSCWFLRANKRWIQFPASSVPQVCNESLACSSVWCFRSGSRNIKLKTSFFLVISSLKVELEKLAQEKTEMQRHYVMVSFSTHSFCFHFFSDFFVLFVGLQNLLLALPPRKSAGRRFSSCNLISFFALFFFPVLWDVVWPQRRDAQTG